MGKEIPVSRLPSDHSSVASPKALLGFAILGAALLVLASACSQAKAPDIGSIYNRSAQYEGIDRNPIIAIPGILGSKLVDPESGQLVWGVLGGGVKPSQQDGARLLALPMREGASLAELTDDVHADGVLDRMKVRLFGLPINIGAYQNVMRTLGIGGYRDKQIRLSDVDYGEGHFTCFQFAYDWRRDLVENAARLEAFIAEKRAYVQEEREKRFGDAGGPVQFDIISHSMGGLLTRYYLRYGAADLPADGSTPVPTWVGAENVGNVIIVGTPNAGAVDALLDLVNGRKFGFGLPTFQPALLGTLPTLYQLLPRDRHGPLVEAGNPNARVERIYDPSFWQEMGWGLLDPDQDAFLQMLLPDADSREARQRIALDHLTKSLARAEQFHRALDHPANVPEHLGLSLIAGDAMPTVSVAAVDRRTGALSASETAPGDGTVLRTSALLDERVGGEWQPGLVSPIAWSEVTFLFQDHLGMTKDPVFTDNILYTLLERPRTRP